MAKPSNAERSKEELKEVRAAIKREDHEVLLAIGTSEINLKRQGMKHSKVIFK